MKSQLMTWGCSEDLAIRVAEILEQDHRTEEQQAIVRQAYEVIKANYRR
jgi:hypothetical protein